MLCEPESALTSMSAYRSPDASSPPVAWSLNRCHLGSRLRFAFTDSSASCSVACIWVRSWVASTRILRSTLQASAPSESVWRPVSGLCCWHCSASAFSWRPVSVFSSNAMHLSAKSFRSFGARGGLMLATAFSHRCSCSTPLNGSGPMNAAMSTSRSPSAGSEPSRSSALMSCRYSRQLSRCCTHPRSCSPSFMAPKICLAIDLYSSSRASTAFPPLIGSSRSKPVSRNALSICVVVASTWVSVAAATWTTIWYFSVFLTRSTSSSSEPSRFWSRISRRQLAHSVSRSSGSPAAEGAIFAPGRNVMAVTRS